MKSHIKNFLLVVFIHRDSAINDQQRLETKGVKYGPRIKDNAVMTVWRAVEAFIIFRKDNDLKYLERISSRLEWWMFLFVQFSSVVCKSDSLIDAKNVCVFYGFDNTGSDVSTGDENSEK